MTEGVRYLPEGVREPETPLEVLQIARDLLKQEGRWLKGDVYQNLDEHGNDVQASTPYCGSWKVCAQGAVFAVALGFDKCKTGEWVTMGEPINTPRSKLYRSAMRLLDECTPQDQREAIFAKLGDAPHTDIVWVQDFNDFGETTLADILAVFDAAIQKAQATTAKESG